MAENGLISMLKNEGGKGCERRDLFLKKRKKGLRGF
jgi:hypothetical protein